MNQLNLRMHQSHSISLNLNDLVSIAPVVPHAKIGLVYVFVAVSKGCNGINPPNSSSESSNEQYVAMAAVYVYGITHLNVTGLAEDKT